MVALEELMILQASLKKATEAMEAASADIEKMLGRVAAQELAGPIDRDHERKDNHA